MLWKSCDERAEFLAQHVINTGATVRSTATSFGISKSTVHKDLSYKLKHFNPGLYAFVKGRRRAPSKQRVKEDMHNANEFP